MKKTITVFTIGFLLFTISAAFRPLSIATTHDDHDRVSNDGVLTTNDDQITTSESETTTQTLFVTRPTMIYHHRHHHPIRFSRSNQINRHFYNDQTANPLRFVRRHPCRNYFHINNNNNNNNNQPSLAAAVELDKSNPSKWLEFKHEYGHRHHHDGEFFEVKYEIDGDKLQMHHHQHKGVGFMRAIRKFLKHAFD